MNGYWAVLLAGNLTGMTESVQGGGAAPGGDSARRRSVVRWRGWSPWSWLALITLTVVGAGVVLVYAVAIVIRASNVCNEPPNPVEVAAAQRGLALVAGVAVVPWVVASLWVKPRLRLLACGVVCAAPAWLAFIDGALRPDSYSMTWCF